jgi:hypothetical protein
VGDLDLIIQLATGTDDSVIHRSAVNRGVRTNLAVITNLDAPRLRNLDPFAAISGEPESVGPNDGPRMDNDPRSDQAFRVNRHPWIKPAFLADRGTFTHDATRSNPGTLADSSAGANDSTRLNGDSGGDERVGRDNGLRMSPRV